MKRNKKNKLFFLDLLENENPSFRIAAKKIYNLKYDTRVIS